MLAPVVLDAVPIDSGKVGGLHVRKRKTQHATDPERHQSDDLSNISDSTWA
jgi:hypothetical protein